ncbi:MAG: hypothetical protein GXY41_00270 [Phycisphaerae bacterium]|nr:hypothetical protein [Phycisphaerae bacterium]
MQNRTTAHRTLWVLGLWVALTAAAPAITSVITRHNSGPDLLKGDADNIVIDSTGTLRLARRTTHIDCGDLLTDVWTVNCLLADARGALFVGTSPNGAVIRILNDKAMQVYPALRGDASVGDGFTNEHIFALGLDVADRLLIGVSGEKGKLIRLGGEAETVFEHDRVQYIFAIARDADNNIYLGTGPEGLIFQLDPFCQNAKIIYDARDKNILSLTIHDDILYAGADQRGLVYKLPLDGSQVTVLYDSEQTEITSLLTDEAGNVYAAATSAQIAAAQLRAASAAMTRAPGRPDSAASNPSSTNATTLNTANTDDAKEEQPPRPTPTPPPTPTPRTAGQIYKITPEGFVTTVFSEMAVFYAMTQSDDAIWLGTGGNGRLYTVDADADNKSIAYEDTLSSQITALTHLNGALYLGLSNPVRLIRLEKGYERRGVYQSPLIDAGQPARWGKIQLEADLPAGTSIMMASRSGNVNDPNDPTFSPWSNETTLTGATDLDSPVGRFVQYRLTLTTPDAETTPVVRESAVSHVVPNLAPQVTSVRTARSRDKNKPGIIEITFTAQDDNRDELIFTIEFRQVGRSRWTLLKNDLTQPRFEWDGRTVEDGRYEVRITADDRKSNSPNTALTGSRISDPFVIDNTPPVTENDKTEIQGNSVILRLSVRDALTVVGKVTYTVNSNEQWVSVQPDDGVYDTTLEAFTIRIDDLKSDSNVIAVSVADDVSNTQYKTYEVEIP